VLGSLRQQVCYPRAFDVSDEDLVSVLQRVGLADLPARVGGLDDEQVAAAQIDVVSVGTRAGLVASHDVLLELLGAGEWRISRTDSSRLTAG
jgi:hypothetical protein